MSRAVTSQTRVAFVAEGTEGTTPNTPGFNVLRCVSESIDVERNYVFSNELNGLRGEKNATIASVGGQGTIGFELSYGTLDLLLASALRSSWSTDVLTDANAPTSAFTFEVKNESGATDIYKRLTGAHVNTLGVEMKAGEIITGSVGLLARNSAFATSAISGATYTAGNTKALMIGKDFASLTLGGGVTIDALASLSMTINNNLRRQMTLGSQAATGIGAGKLEISGQMTMFLDAAMASLLTAYADGTQTGLDFTLGSVTTEKYQIELPSVVLSNLKTDSANDNADVMVTADWRALQSSTLSGAVARITRAVA